MSDQVPEQPKSFMLITFPEYNSVDMQVNFVNVSPAQVLAACAMMEVRAKNAWVIQENERLEREAQMRISKPPDKIIVGR